MAKRKLLTASVVGISLVTAAAAAAPPVEWDGLQRVSSKRMDLVYLQPGADFRAYTKVIVDPTEVSFQKNWRRDYNSTTVGLGSRVSEADIQKAISEGVTAASDIFAKAWTKGGYAVVTEPGPDVLRVKTAIANISVTSPDRQSIGRSYTFSEDAGRATFVIEARDSMTGALLGRAVDQKIVGDDTRASWRTSVSNRADFRDVVERWAANAVRGLTELKGLAAQQPAPAKVSQ